ncbi:MULTISPECIES: CoA-disulfide reductase [unclassified Gilliamella]|uniref:CoA-disulfide reductase n=1 Tax=unclassified Gilliamella TaxID=2685620 RepID=UPI00226A76C0|nr:MULTISPECIES: CoA-disulfide reductase [unclassified Gilliamella]MCX8596991.1 CoA-disulfide reductase [Gilliamella sp. B3493]MCX8600082.1 CoA-disulfide reductase [Gilliamella sp. B3486]MCX8690388.1 CoA-disulfide reductase [Gilliamella sp. B2973]MCX8706071.1 CoA-disulfide reductase [Gilliamella sp. B3127]
MKIIIIGAQAAGASAAAKAKRRDPNATICIYEKSDIVSFGACGLPYFIGNHFGDENEMISRTPEQFAKDGIEIKTLHEVIAIDPNLKKVTVKDIKNNNCFEDDYDKLLIAVGATPIIPPLKNLQLENIFTLRDMYDGLAIKKALNQNSNVVVIGAGYIGLEITESLVKLNKNVKLIQLDDRVLTDAFDPELTEIIEENLKQHCDLHLQEQVQGFEGEQKVTHVITDKAKYPADIVIIATGVKPNSEVYKHLNIETLSNGAIVVDNYGQTNIADIYAAGDCVALHHRVSQSMTYIPLATGANKLGKIVGDNLAGGNNQFPGTLGTSALRVFDIEAGRTGLTEQQAIKAGIPYKTVVVKDKNHSNYVEGQTSVTAKLIYHAETRILLGGQIAGGSGAVLRTNSLATAIWANMKIDELAMMDFLYAPPFSRPWDILNIAGGIAK